MAITQAVCNSFKVEILKGLHNFTATTGNAFKLALYDNEATLSKSTTAFQQTPNTPNTCLLYTSPSPRDRQKSRMPSSA